MVQSVSQTLPTLDFRRFEAEPAERASFLADLRAAARGPGFFYLVGHGLDSDLIDQVLKLSKLKTEIIDGGEDGEGDEEDGPNGQAQELRLNLLRASAVGHHLAEGGGKEREGEQPSKRGHLSHEAVQPARAEPIRDTHPLRGR